MSIHSMTAQQAVQPDRLNCSKTGFFLILRVGSRNAASGVCVLLFPVVGALVEASDEKVTKCLPHRNTKLTQTMPKIMQPLIQLETKAAEIIVWATL
jgi:hypothetical protein